MVVVLIKKQSTETLKLIVNFQLMKRSSFVMDQNKNYSDHRKEVTL